MTVHTPHLRIGALAMLALSATLLGLPVRAAGKAAPQGAHAFYMHQRALCATQRPADERDDCLSEASTAYAATQPSLPGDDADSLLRNKLRRCEPLRGADQLDCQARMRGEGTVSGSVASGGIYRELVTIVPGVPAAAAPVSAAVPEPVKSQ
ncbi:MAG: hypothetical protein IPJ08_14910 [Burkholderiales bacterium]|nr:hypothetical protein [Burkholderiales bacterium]